MANLKQIMSCIFKLTGEKVDEKDVPLHMECLSDVTIPRSTKRNSTRSKISGAHIEEGFPHVSTTILDEKPSTSSLCLPTDITVRSSARIIKSMKRGAALSPVSISNFGETGSRWNSERISCALIILMHTKYVLNSSDIMLTYL